MSRSRSLAAVDGFQVVITGGEGGLGRCLADHFRVSGALVEAPGRSVLDVTDAAAVERFFSDRPVDLLVCAAGLADDALLPRQDEDSWDRQWEVNFAGARRCALAAIHTMRRRGGGHVVFVSSHSAIHPPAGQCPYAAAKAALLGLTQDLAAEFGPDNIRVNAVLPGFLETRMTAPVSPSRRATVLGEHALGRFNTPEEVAAFIRFLHTGLPHTSGQWFQLDSRRTVI